MAQSAPNLSHLPVSGCDLFLLVSAASIDPFFSASRHPTWLTHRRPQKEKWDADSTLSPDEQMRRIFARFLELPLDERQVCTDWFRPPSRGDGVDSLWINR